ncbi:MAG: squalene synthase HpnC [Hyphomicrobiales bacterium]|nr:squalene synthase HpnC [Hyphomicrobiales bacterium]
MTDAANAIAAAASGKGAKDENFPVAALLRAQYRPAVMAFYNFVRAGDDVADNPTLAPQEKLALLDQLADALTGEGAGHPVALPLKQSLAERNLSPRHALDLLDAFRLDVTKNRYRDFDDLIDYCRLSAMPVGRFVLDLHGESQNAWPANDALCAALQIINHLQDCGKDYRTLGRVYLPEETLLRHGADVAMLAQPAAPAPLRAALAELAQRTQDLLAQSAIFPRQVRDLRLAMNVAAIQKLAERLNQGLLTRDPLSQNVHASKASFVLSCATAALATLVRRAAPAGGAA